MSEQTRKNLQTAAQFKMVKTPSGKVAYEAYCAIFNGENEIAVCAPTLEALDEAWSNFSAMPLNREKAQFVWIVKAKEV